MTKFVLQLLPNLPNPATERRPQLPMSLLTFLTKQAVDVGLRAPRTEGSAVWPGEVIISVPVEYPQ